ncbi:JmjC domain protein, partial [Opisthorchis viverrini]
MPLSGSEEFIEELLQRTFRSTEGHVQVMKGCDVNGHSLICDGFNMPILVTEKDGLRMRVPPENFMPEDLLKFMGINCFSGRNCHIDPNFIVDVIDVRLQAEVQMALGDFVGHFVSKHRVRLLNMLSLEFSQTSLSKLVEPPHVVSELSLISNCWITAPDDEFGEVSDDGSSVTSIPSVQKYCLMSMKGSYTDFHIDFGGSSVWYHVVWVRHFAYVYNILQGEKIFYLIPPTHENRRAYWRWIWNPDHRTIFLPDLLGVPKDEPKPPVFELHVGPGQTILLPAGWIHAVYTPSDCLVFGGNFLSELHIPIQLSVYRMEQKSETPRKFQFPNFEKIHWFVADCIAGRLTNALYDNREPAAYEIEAAHALAKVLPRWLEKRLTLPPDERLYYLPSRATMELSYSQLIDKLEELSSILLPTPCKGRCSSIKPEKSKLDHSDKHSSGKSKSSVHEETVKQRSVYPSSTPKRSAGGGLGWLPDRAMRQKSSDVDQTVTGNQPVTEDQDILEALPELNESRLIGDH